MGYAARSLQTTTVPYPQFRLIEGGRGKRVQGIRREVIILGFILASLQILDAVLTAIGISHWGVHAEGNALLRTLMHVTGPITALIIAKSLAIGVIGTLCFFSKRVAWIPLALKCVIGVYLVAAIIPWTFLIIGKIVLA